MKKNTDVIIIGSGMAGLAQAALLAQRGIAVTVVDREDPAFLATEAFDARTVAFSQGTKEILSPLGVWKTWEHAAEAITEIDVQEGRDPFVLNFEATDSEADAFGWILPNTLVRKTLYEAAKKSGAKFVTGVSLDRIATDEKTITALLSDGAKITAQLLIGADGRNSRVRALTGVPTVEWDYKQTALVGLVHHEHAHRGLAVERFYIEGPFAVLPFTDDEKGNHRSAIVWTKHGKDVCGVPSLSDITNDLLPFFDERYGRVEAIGKWAAYPLGFCHAKKMIAKRVALISDAAHGMHPIAGQGLNVGMRDVAVLVEVLPTAKGDFGAPELLEKYQRARRFDVMAMMAATDILNRLFGKKFLPVRKLRSAGLGIVNALPPLKRFFANVAMGK
jgi:2-octaprenyl-6-methoxyphenol hydroxylase